MSRITERRPSTLTSIAVALAALILLPGIALAEHHEEGDVASQVKAKIMKDNQYIRENLEDADRGISQHGSLAFWSSGGLMNSVPPDAAISKYDVFKITPKHITVIELPGGEAAVAMYYSEGSMQVKGSSPVSHYMTRVTQVYVKEDGEWNVRAAHWSPVAAGSGTTQSSLD